MKTPKPNKYQHPKDSANYATFNGPGRFESLKLSVASIIDQVHFVRIFCNDKESFDNCSSFFTDPKVTIEHDGRDLADLGKFAFLPIFGKQFYFTCDDDIIYPEGFVKYTKKRLRELGGVVTYNGRRINVKDKFRYYHGTHKTFNFKQARPTDERVDIPGTGVMCFQTEQFYPIAALNYESKMSDLVIAYLAKVEQIPIHVLRHSANFFKFTSLPGIWDEFQGNDLKQVKLLNKIIDYAPTRKNIN